GADDPESFWRLLRDGRDMIREVPPDRWDAAAYYDPDPTAPGKSASRWGGFLDQVDRFDPFFFGISPGEAERMDPQQRLLMELAYEAFEDAGYPMSRLAGSRTAVVVGISVNEYGLLQHGRHELLNGHSGTGAALAIAANRISYFFDLHGPSLAVDTACSSSLMAVHLACQSLASGECDVALAGGVNLILSPAHSIAFTKAGVLAPDGRCKPFDAAADGYVRGEGGGLVVLKPLASAVAAGDSIYAVIRGGAVFQDGRTNGLMAPNRDAQEAVLRAAYANAGVSPGDVQYLETHGTGTLLGDSMEAHAIGRVASAGRRETPLALGSVKSNLGHLEAAAGAAGLIKVALALRQGAIPPSLHFTSPNPHVPFEALGLRVQRELANWPRREGPRLAGVSSFGFGGTNVHLVLEEAPRMAVPSTAEDGTPHLVPLSGHSREALAAVARRFRDLVAGSAPEAGPGLAELAANAALRRTHLDQRLGVIARSKAELVERLDLYLRGESHPEVVVSGEAETGRRRLAFVFSGQGSQWHGMGSELFRREPVFRANLEACDAALGPELGWSLIDRLFGGEGGAALETIDVIQPALFGIQVALAALWRSWGVEPDAVVGHSMGEVAAAYVSGGLTLEAAARVVAVRSRLLRRLSGQGGMALVALPAEVTATHLSGRAEPLAIAASNGPRSTVVAGDAAALDALLTR
ncbi:MAG TPA: type I polyketide synthase, partial [Gemmatimonadales bacterium]|nr:type I polyketide synthase [Gemmatimonadales bacterium]